MKRYFYLIFFPIALIAQTATAPSSGDGSSGDPYQIDTLNNLYWRVYTDQVDGAVEITPTQRDRIETKSLQRNVFFIHD
jgi:hypothetical protein